MIVVLYKQAELDRQVMEKRKASTFLPKKRSVQSGEVEKELIRDRTKLPTDILAQTNDFTQSQHDLLHNSQLHTAQHQALAIKIGQTHGNSYLQRLIGNHSTFHPVQRENTRNLQLAKPQPKPKPKPNSGLWNNLPSEAQDLLIRSHALGINFPQDKNYWIWNQSSCRSTETCFNAVEKNRQQAFLDVCNALIRQDLLKMIAFVIEFHPENTRGIFFIPMNREQLASNLSQRNEFCHDAWYGGGSKSKPKWREVVNTSTAGLHIVLPTSGPCDAHIDSISPVEYREDTGKCNYDVLVGIKHWAKEEKGWFRNKK